MSFTADLTYCLMFSSISLLISYVSCFLADVLLLLNLIFKKAIFGTWFDSISATGYVLIVMELFHRFGFV